MNIFNNLKLSEFRTHTSNVDLWKSRKLGKCKNEKKHTSHPCQLNYCIHDESKDFSAFRDSFTFYPKITLPRYARNHFKTSFHSRYIHAQKKRFCFYFILTWLFRTFHKLVTDPLLVLYLILTMTSRH